MLLRIINNMDSNQLRYFFKYYRIEGITGYWEEVNGLGTQIFQNNKGENLRICVYSTLNYFKQFPTYSTI